LSTWAIVVAAGVGERLGGGRPKAFAPLAGRPLLAESLERLEACQWVDAIVVVAPPGWEEPTILLAEEIAVAKVATVVTGAETRTGSVRAGLSEVPEDALVVLVHDAARPLVTDEVVGRVLGPLSEGFEGAVPALPLVDTVKRIAGDVVVETVARANLVAVQTPQAFLAATLRRAHADPSAEGTDCSSLVERIGGRVKVVGGDYRLIKVTTQSDLELVESWLAG
jgi:2-C-methyl-D-erythritol 4-phosphate cytidylyltransferase